MKVALSEEQEAIRVAARELFARLCPPSETRAAWDAPPSPARWRALVDAGHVGLLASGYSEVELCLVLEEAGRVALPEPLVDTAMVAVPLLGAIEGTVAAGPVLFAEAESYLIEDASGLHLLRRDAVTLEAVASVDRSRRLHRVTWKPADGQQVGGPDEARAAHDRGALGTAAMLVGLGRQLLEMTVAYVKVRQQFGKPVGSFQAVKHHLAGAHVQLELAGPTVRRAAVAMAGREAHRDVRVAMAKALASEAASQCARVALQCHGAIGYAFENDLHLWMKRAWALASSWGDARAHRARVAAAVLDDGLELEMGV